MCMGRVLGMEVKVRDVACGLAHTVVCDWKGGVWSWGGG